LKKKYEFEHSVKIVNKTKDGLTLEAGGNLSNDFQGFIKSKHLSSQYGTEFDGEVYTSAASESKATLKLKKLAKGLTVTIGHSTADKAVAVDKVALPACSADFEYAQEYFASQIVARTNLKRSKIDASAAVGFEGLSLGGQLVVNVMNGSGSDLADSNVAMEYTKDDLTASVFTENNLDVVNSSFFHRVNRSTSLAALMKYSLSSGNRNLTVGVEHQLDQDTLVKGKAELPTGAVSFALEHRLANPKLQFGIAAQLDGKKIPLATQKYGLSFTFGDF